jgi:hypothetical protein
VGLAKETAHQLGTPISSLMGWVECIENDIIPDNAADEMKKDIDRLQIITERFSKIGSTPVLEIANINLVLETSLKYLSNRISNSVDFQWKLYPKPVMVNINVNLFNWVIENVVKNSVDAMEGKGRLRVEVNFRNNLAFIDVIDNGKGIPRNQTKDIFKPGFTTKKRGWGLGLSLAKRIVEDYHKGQIFVKESHAFDKTVIQKWYAGTNEGTVRKGDTEQTTGVRGRYLRQADGTYLIIGKIGPWNGNRPGNFPTIFGKEVGLSQVGDINQDLRYSKSVGNNITPDQEFKNSEMLINMAYYADAKQPYSTKFTDKESQSVKDVEDNLKKVLDTIISAGYTYNGLTSTDIINQQFSNESYKGYDFIKQLTKDPYSQQREESPFNYRGGYLAQFGLNKRKQLLDDPKGKGLAGSMASDKINLLTVLNEEDVGLDKKYNGDNDDIIKFYFHDLVNNKYIPFRATITGLNENYNGDWTAIEYIGRADKLQSYKGFSRTIGFKFNVVANTIKELLPMWQRINYLVGLTKPANYTQGGQSNSNVYSRFIIPPLVKFTIGDIYKNQPGVIKSIGLNIPENCVWETVSEETSAKFDWSYLNGRIQWQDSIGKVAQFPRECELNINMDLLEKERPVVGGTNFGDYYVETRMGGQMSGMTNQNEILDEKGTVDSFSKNLYMNFPGGITLSTQRAIDQIKNNEIAMQNANNAQAEVLQQEIALNKTADEIRSAAEQYNYQLKMEQEEQAANRRDQFESSYMNVNNQPTQDRLNEEYEMDRTGL